LNKKGFTLVEVLIAAAVFIVTVTCFGQMLKVSSNYVRITRKFSRDLYLARSRMEELWRVSPSSEMVSIQVEVGKVRLNSLRSKY